MVAYLQKSEGSEGFHQIIAFLNASHIQYALTENPTIYVSFITQFWRTSTARTSANGKVELTATIDGQVKTITEASLRRHLKLDTIVLLLHLIRRRRRRKEEERINHLKTRSRYVSDQDMCFRKKGRRENNRSEKIHGKRFCFLDGVAQYL
ncbi:hypothetical protein Tco_0705671 [Tanacetum coccineum]|uniref:Uncharacterized protein n=1 Tax=Tanacetum coccineum TaxID=301880 RepID=A0ABQ4Y650_9ASTR